MLYKEFSLWLLVFFINLPVGASIVIEYCYFIRADFLLSGGNS